MLHFPLGRKLDFYATCNPGLESALSLELESLGAIQIQPMKAGVKFQGHTLETGMKACLWSRTAVRVLLKVGFPAFFVQMDGPFFLTKNIAHDFADQRGSAVSGG
jgi:23S rRNA G2445 N2-methylase RlmL